MFRVRYNRYFVYVITDVWGTLEVGYNVMRFGSMWAVMLVYLYWLLAGLKRQLVAVWVAAYIPVDLELGWRRLVANPP